ncbi:RNA polymerase sigma factor [Clostridium sp. DL1XJH146]
MNDFDEIYRLYGDQIFKYLVCLTGNIELAEELTQETFYQAIKSINNFKGECKLSVWLCQIAKFSYYKYRNNHCKRKNELENTNIYIQAIETPENILINSEDKLKLYKAIHKLKEPYKEVVNLRTFGELKFKEIGDVFNQSENWARITFYRGKLKLKEILIDIERSENFENQL